MAYSPDFRTYPGARQSATATTAVLDAGLRAYMLRVYNWMTSGLVLTGIVAWLIVNTAALDAFLAEHKVAGRKQSGSALKFGLLAEGEADLYPRFGPTMEWDTAAGHAVLDAAGGRIETVSGAPLLYGKPGLRNPDFIAWGAG